jgi:hypothetical protein
LHFFPVAEVKREGGTKKETVEREELKGEGVERKQVEENNE